MMGVSRIAELNRSSLSSFIFVVFPWFEFPPPPPPHTFPLTRVLARGAVCA